MTAQETRDARPVVEIEIVSELGAVVVKLRGEHDLSTQPRVSDALAVAVGHAPKVLVDLGECTFADSSLVKVLVQARARFDDSITLEVVIPPQATAVRRLAEIARLADIVPVYESREAAIDRLRRSS